MFFHILIQTRRAGRQAPKVVHRLAIFPCSFNGLMSKMTEIFTAVQNHTYLQRIFLEVMPSLLGLSVPAMKTPGGRGLRSPDRDLGSVHLELRAIAGLGPRIPLGDSQS